MVSTPQDLCRTHDVAIIEDNHVYLERDRAHPLSGWVELDDAYLGGERSGGKRGRGAPGKTPFVAAVETNDEGHPLRMKLIVVEGHRRPRRPCPALRHRRSGRRGGSMSIASFGSSPSDTVPLAREGTCLEGFCAGTCRSDGHRAWREIMRATHREHELRTAHDSGTHPANTELVRITRSSDDTESGSVSMLLMFALEAQRAIVEVITSMNPTGLTRPFSACAFALFLLGAWSTHAETAPVDNEHSDWYAALSGFHAIPRDSDTSRPTELGLLTGETEYAGLAAFSAAVGTYVTENVRLELEVGYAPVNIEALTNLRLDGHPVGVPYSLTGDSDVWTLTLAASYDFPTQGPVRPYVGAGLGIAHHETRTTFTFAGNESVAESGDDTVLSYHLRGGIGYELSDTAVVFAGYRYTGARDIEIGGTRSPSVSDALEAGVRIRF